MRGQRLTSRHMRRRGTALVLVVLALIPLMAFAALAIDLGLLAVARTQAQQAADAAAMSGARTINGNSANNNNYSSVGSNPGPGTNKILCASMVCNKGSRWVTSQVPGFLRERRGVFVYRIRMPVDAN